MSNKTQAKTQGSNLQLSDIFGPPMAKEQIMEKLKKDAETYERFLNFPPKEQERLLSFMAGQQGLQITYDPFFQKVFSPYMHPERLESFLSALFHEQITIEKVLPREGERLGYEAHIIILDILVKLSNGSHINVEFQKIGLNFPGERSSCYIADSIMKEYNELKIRLGENFSYKSMRPVYLIVLMEKSSQPFKQVAPNYIHTLKTHFDSGAKINTLENVIYISLDTFQKTVQTINSKLDAWLTFFSSDKPADILKLVQAYPEFRDLYTDIAAFRKNIKELIAMASEALTIADNNTVKMMYDEMQEEIVQMQKTIADLGNTLANQNKAIADKDKAIADKDKAIADKDKEIDKLLAEIQRLESIQ